MGGFNVVRRTDKAGPWRHRPAGTRPPTAAGLTSLQRWHFRRRQHANVPRPLAWLVTGERVRFRDDHSDYYLFARWFALFCRTALFVVSLLLLLWFVSREKGPVRKWLVSPTRHFYGAQKKNRRWTLKDLRWIFQAFSVFFGQKKMPANSNIESWFRIGLKEPKNFFIWICASLLFFMFFYRHFFSKMISFQIVLIK